MSWLGVFDVAMISQMIGITKNTTKNTTNTTTNARDNHVAGDT